jgi:hypothetical protein
LIARLHGKSEKLLMSDQDFPRQGAPDAGPPKAAKGPFSSASTFAQDAAGKAKQAASDTAAGLSEDLKELMNRQIGGGAVTLRHVGRSTKRRADDLQLHSPFVAGLVRALGSQIETYADDLRHQSVDQLWESAADFTRRRPTLVFGLAALTGFFALRLVKSSPSVPAPSIQPSDNYTSGQGGYYRGS